jgi:hypothetical protein
MQYEPSSESLISGCATQQLSSYLCHCLHYNITAASLSSSSATWHTSAGWERHLLGDAPGALQQFDKALQSEPDSPMALFCRGVVEEQVCVQNASHYLIVYFMACACSHSTKSGMALVCCHKLYGSTKHTLKAQTRAVMYNKHFVLASVYSLVLLMQAAAHCTASRCSFAMHQCIVSTYIFAT